MSPDATFTIGELAARTGMTPDALRYYERLRVIAPRAVPPPGTASTPARRSNA